MRLSPKRRQIDADLSSGGFQNFVKGLVDAG